MITNIAKIGAAQAYLDNIEPEYIEYDEFMGECEYYSDNRVLAAFCAGVRWAQEQMQSESLTNKEDEYETKEDLH